MMGTDEYLYLLSCQCILYIVRSFSSFPTIHRPSMILPSKNHKHATDHSPSRSSNSISVDHVSSMSPEQFTTPNKPTWHYFTIIRPQGLPIKISATSAEELQPVYDGIATFLDKEAELKEKRRDIRDKMHRDGMLQGQETYY